MAAPSLPLYRRLKDDLRRAIAQGTWTEGSKIPSENELVAKHGLSRMTVHRAIRELVDEGWLYRVRGAGTYVAGNAPQSPIMAVKNIAEEIKARGHKHQAKVERLKTITASAEQARLFDLSPGAKLFHSLILHFDEESPIQLEERLVNPKAAPHYLKQDFTAITPYDYLVTAAPLDEVEHFVEAVLPEASAARLLGIGAQDPCLLLTRRTWSSGQIVTYAKLLHPGSRFRFFGRFSTKPPFAES